MSRRCRIRLAQSSGMITQVSIKFHSMQELCVEEMLNIVNLHLDGVLACTLDYGGLQVFDSRIGLSKPSFKMNTGKPVIPYLLLKVNMAGNLFHSHRFVLFSFRNFILIVQLVNI